MYHMAVSLSGIKFCPTCILAIYENLSKLKSPCKFKYFCLKIACWQTFNFWNVFVSYIILKDCEHDKKDENCYMHTALVTDTFIHCHYAN